MLILLIISVILNVIIFYGAYNCIKKNEIFEKKIFYFYQASLNILRECKELDRRQMFEKDDEVGILFQRLLEVIGELRNIIYETEEKEEET